MRQNRDEKIKKLLQDSRKLYHIQDLAVLWGIENPNTLYTTVKRYLKRGLLSRVYKGFYSTKPLNEIDAVVLGLSALRAYGYLSTETVLAQSGIIFQQVHQITLVSDRNRHFEIGGQKFLVRKMKPDYLYNEVGIIASGLDKRATLERAVADMLYFNPKYHFDAGATIDWNKVKLIQTKIGY
ncbi:hypothetical protein B6D52_03320 [Candidatus Parcubacteria bacterium 4484_255]|nr:MAG: hypothetical protein B6D52_03320 [Candidatus Parcubacteria bacterium 4484_255]